LAVDIYRSSSSFPKHEAFGLTSQIRRAGASIPTNIAEGAGRSGSAEFMRFLHIAMGSACELEYQLLLAKDLGYIESADHQRLEAHAIDVKQMLSALQKKVTDAGSHRQHAAGVREDSFQWDVE
jgi:four helix bundle protein